MSTSAKAMHTLPVSSVRVFLFKHAIKCTVRRLIKLTKLPVQLQFRCGSGKLIFAIISPCFAISKNVVNNLEPGERPRYSAFHKVTNYVQRS